MKKVVLTFQLICVLIPFISAQNLLTTPFVHPGMAQNQQDLNYMRDRIAKGVEPWKTAYENLKKRTLLDFTPKPFTEISVGPYGANSIGGREFSQSATAVYNHALIWYITQEKAYAEKTIEILNAWAYKLRSFDANNAKLNVGLDGYYFLNAAEIIKHTYTGWSEKDMDQFTRMILTVFYPTIKDFFTEANGNWDASMISTMMCIGVFVEDHSIFNRAVERFYRGEGNSGITKYLYPGGQCQETTRDWGHVQLGIGEFAKAAQTAYTQGLDFYSVANDRLAQGYEYTAKFLLGEDIELFGVLSTRAMDRMKDVYESIYQHYTEVKGISLPYTKRIIQERTREKFPVGFLTATRVPVASEHKILRPLVIESFLSATETGALLGKYKKAPVDVIVIQPGESIQQAIDANKGTGKWIVLATGVHTLNGPLKIYSSITLAGQGRETILFLSPQGGTPTLMNGETSLQNVVIRDLLIEGAVKTVENQDPNHDRRGRSYMSASTREGIVLRVDNPGDINNVLFENVTVQNCTKHGVSIVGATNVTINRCDFSDNGSSVVPGAGLHHNLQLSYITNSKIINSRFDTSPWGCGIDLLFGKDITISGCEMARNRLSGLRCSESKNITVTGSLAEGNDESGIAFETWKDGSDHITIKNNTCRNNTLYGIYSEGNKNKTIEGNVQGDNGCGM